MNMILHKCPSFLQLQSVFLTSPESRPSLRRPISSNSGRRSREGQAIMGNYISCSSKSVPSNTVKVIGLNGSVQELQRRIKAAELMLENPQQFVCHANGLQIGRRINPLTADEDLDLGHLYFLIPMAKLNSVLSGTDMASLAFKANSAMKAAGRNSSARILPVFGDLSVHPLLQEMKRDDHLEDKEFTVPKLNLEDVPELSTAVQQLRLSAFRSWKPKLETINEFRPKLRDLMHSNIEQFC